MQIAVKHFKVLNPPSEPAEPNSIYLVQPTPADPVAFYATDADGNLKPIVDSALLTLTATEAAEALVDGLSKADVGLGNVDNTPDASKPVSTAQAAADAAVLTAANTYTDSAVVGLLDDRGNYNASGNTFPSSGGSGAGGAVKKGDLWTVSVAGALGFVTVTPGDVVRALVDNPGQTGSNWAITENNLGYTPASTSALATGLATKADGLPGVKVYRAIVSQSGSSAPTATVLENSLGGAVGFSRDDAGAYYITSASLFPVNKTLVFSNGANVITHTLVATSSEIEWSMSDDNWTASLEILVYP